MKQNTTLAYKALIMPILIQYLPHGRIYLFGSRAQGTQREGSDIDIAIDLGMPIELSLLLQVKNRLEDLDIPVKIDLLDYQTALAPLQTEIIKHGVIWNS